MDDFLKSSDQCEITEKIRDISKSIEGEEFEFIVRLLRWLNKNIKYSKSDDTKNEIFRKRPANQIIEDGFATGCTDFALVFIAIARAKGIPTKYVEAISTDYFDDKDLSKVRGHVFAECLIKEEWFGVDPMGGNLKFNTRYPGYVIYAKGLDSWDLGIFDMKSIREKFIPFAQEYNSKKNGWKGSKKPYSHWAI